MDVTGHRVSRHDFVSHLFRTAWGSTYMTIASRFCVQSMMDGLLYRHVLLYMDVLHWQRSFRACVVYCQKYRRIDLRRCTWKPHISSLRFNRTTGAYGRLLYIPHHLKRLSKLLPRPSFREAG